MKNISRKYINEYERLFKKALESSTTGYYDESALPSYTHRNSLISWLFWKRIDVVFGMIEEISKNHREYSVLDFGCGGGVTLGYLGKKGYEVSGCDVISHELCRTIASDLGVKARIEDSLESVLDRKYDVILALDALEHVGDLDTTLAKLKQSLKIDGRLIVSGPTENLLYRIGRWLAGFHGEYHHANIYDIERKLSGLGYRKQKETLLYPMAPLFNITMWSC